jgi:putative ABC transport system substrate-binding protein
MTPNRRVTLASHIGRRKFLATLGGAVAAWPLAARAQQPAMPVIGYLNLGSPESDAFRLTGLRRGLNQSGYVEGRNFVIEYRWAGNQADRLPELAADLVQLRVAVIVAPALPSTLAAKAATTSIPIVFAVDADPVRRWNSIYQPEYQFGQSYNEGCPEDNELSENKLW